MTFIDTHIFLRKRMTTFVREGERGMNATSTCVFIVQKRRERERRNKFVDNLDPQTGSR